MALQNQVQLLILLVESLVKKLQTRTKTRVGVQSNGGTQRGAHATVENGSTGADPDPEEHSYLETMEKLVPGQTLDVEAILVKSFISKMYLIEFHLIIYLLVPPLTTIKFSVVYL